MRQAALFPLLGAFFSFAALALLVFVLIGSIQPKTLLKDIYFFKLDAQNLGTDLVPSLATLSDGDKANLQQFSTITVGLWNYCWWNSDGIVGCTDPSAHFNFALVDVVHKSLGFFVPVNSPGSIADNSSKIETMSKSTIALFIAGIGLAAISLLMGIISVKKFRLIRTITALLLFLAFAASLVASALATGLYLYMKNQYDDGPTSVVASLGRVGLGIAWGSALAGLLGFIFASIGICTHSRRGDRAMPEKQPFLDDNQMDLSYQQPPAPYSNSPPDMFANHGHSGSLTKEPQFIQPTYYDDGRKL